MKLLLDTDIGSDIDDAVCLAYLLANPECELLGVTTVSGLPVERARLASALCTAAGRLDVPVYPGAELAMTGLQRQPTANQAAVLPRWPYRKQFPEGQAVQFLAETIDANAGEVTLLAIGPMTNVGQLFKQHPGAAAKLKSLMLMSGRFGPKPPNARSDHEWNVYCDPVAADIVYRTPMASHRSVGLDVTLKVQLPKEEVRRRFAAHPLLRVVLDMAEVWYRGRDVTMTFHDPLAAVCVFDEQLCRFERGRVTVRLDDGVTVWDSDPDGPHAAAMEVDPVRFFDVYFGPFHRSAG